MTPSEKNTKRVILALDQAYEKFIQLEDNSTDEAEIVAYRCYYTNIYESKLYVEQMQKEIDRLNELLKEQQPKKGHWEKSEYASDRWHQCSECGTITERVDKNGYKLTCNFCRICGADMRGEQE